MAIDLLTALTYHYLGEAQAVASVFADCANNETHLAWPSQPYISARLNGLPRRTVQRHIASLCEAGILVDTGQRVGKTKSVVVYRVAVPQLEQSPTTPPPESSAINGAACDGEVVPQMAALPAPCDQEATPSVAPLPAKKQRHSRREAAPSVTGSSAICDQKQRHIWRTESVRESVRESVKEPHPSLEPLHARAAGGEAEEKYLAGPPPNWTPPMVGEEAWQTALRHRAKKKGIEPRGSESWEAFKGRCLANGVAVPNGRGGHDHEGGEA